MKTRILIIVMLIFTAGELYARTVIVSSPEKSGSMSISYADGKLSYDITKDKTTIIEPSRMQWMVNDVLLGDNVSSIKLLKKYKENSTYKTRGAHSIAINNYKGLLISIDEIKDLTPIVLAYKGEQGNDRQAQRVGENTQTQHFATAGIYASPFLCYAVSPEDLLRNPDKDFVCSIAPVWDETIVLPGSEINQVALFARRNGDTWFIAGTKIEQRIDSILLSFLGDGDYECVSVNDVQSNQQAIDMNQTTVTRKDTLVIKMNKAGGCLAKLRTSPIF